MNSLAVAQFDFSLDGFLFERSEDYISEGHLEMSRTIARNNVGIANFGDVVQANAQADVDHHFVCEFFVQFVGYRLVSRLVEQVWRQFHNHFKCLEHKHFFLVTVTTEGLI